MFPPSLINKKKLLKILPVLVLLFVTVLLFWKFVFLGYHPYPYTYLLAWFEPWKSEHVINDVITIAHKPIAEDVFRQIIPLKNLAIDMMKKGEPPLWNPYNGSGMPLLATLNNGFLDPFNILYLFFSKWFAWSFYIFLQPFIIGICTYLFCRKIKFSVYASLFSAVAFIFSGFVIARLVFGMYGLAIALLPFILFIFESYVQDNRTKIIVFLPIAVYSLIVSTQPQITFYILGFTCFYFFYRVIFNQTNRLTGTIIPFLFLLLGIGLASIQLLPTIELFKIGNISTTNSKAIFEIYLLPWQHLISILIPNFFGNVSTYNYWGNGEYIQTVASIGTIPCLFVFLSIFLKPKSIPAYYRFFVLSIPVTILLTMDWIGAWLFSSIPIPLVSTGIPSRIFLLTTFSLVILSGDGLDRFLAGSKSNRKLFILTGIYTVFVLLIPAITFIISRLHIPCINRFIPQCYSIALRNSLLEITIFVFFIVLIFLLRLPKNNLVLHIQKVLPLLFITVIGLYNGNKFLPFNGEDIFLPETNLIKTIKTKMQDGRVFGLGGATLTTNIATNFRFYDPQYYHPLYIGRYRELLEYSNTGYSKQELPRGDVRIDNALTLTGQAELRRQRLFTLLGITYLIYKQSEKPMINTDDILWQDSLWYLTRYQSALPRTYLVNDFEVIGNRQQLLNRLFANSFDPQKTVILEKPVTLSKPETIPTYKLSKPMYAENSVSFKTASGHNSLLVLLDNFYPGWKAYIDGTETEILRANYTFRAVLLPSGEHTVLFSYEPASFRFGVYLSLFFLTMYFFILIMWPKIRGKKNK